MDRETSSRSQEKRLQAVVNEYRRQRDSGQSVDQQAFIRAYPELAHGLESYFQNEAGHIDPALASTKLGKSSDQAISGRETMSQGHIGSHAASESAARHFGRYRLLRPLGEGAMGSVFLAEDTHLDRRIALKMPRCSAADKLNDKGEFLARFTREAKAAAGLKHANICSVYDAGEIDGTAYITMDFIDGVPLSELVGSDRLTAVPEIIRLIRTIADAVHHAHSKGIIHRDLKPGNILVDDQMNPFVTDFGLARRDASSDGSRITQEGLLIGTPAYMAPEQVRGEQAKVGVTSDIYSLGVIFFELLTARLPFEGSVPEMLAKVLRDPPPVPSRLRPDLTEDADDVVWKMLLKDPDRRYPSMLEVIAAIEKLSDKLKQVTSRQTTTSARATEAVAQSPFEIQKSHIELMLKKGQYASAIRDLEALAEEQIPAAKVVAEWARKILPNAKKEAKALSPSGLAAMLKTAEQMFEKCDYHGCIQLLDDVPSLKRSEPMETLLRKAQQREATAEELMEQIRDKERRENPEGLDVLVKKYLKLKPGNAYAKKLWTALQTYSTSPASRRYYRFERGRLQPMPEISFFRRYALLAILVGTLSFLATYAYVIVYLKSGSQTVAVHVDDEWLKAQGGQLTLTVDGDEHTINTSSEDGVPLTIVVNVGEREFSVKHGDAVVHNPRMFTIERDGKNVLQITPTDIELRNSPLIVSGPIGGEKGEQPDEASTTEATSTNGPGPWIDLFDGKDTSRWQTLGQFQVENGLLIARNGKTIAVSKDEFDDFELEVEWRLSGTTTNGGIYYRELATTQNEGNLYQIIAPTDRLVNKPLVRTGALYGVLPAKEGIEKPIDEWNFTKIVCRGPVVEHWLNNELLFTYDTTSAEWRKVLSESSLPRGKDQIGTARKGHILLDAEAQTGDLAYRKVRIRELTLPTGITSSSPSNLSDLEKIATGQWKPLVTDKTVLPEPEKMSWKDGVLTLNKSVLPFPSINARNIVIKAEIRRVDNKSGDIQLRTTKANNETEAIGSWNFYSAWCWHSEKEGVHLLEIQKTGNPWQSVKGQTVELPVKKGEFVSMAFASIDDRLMLFVDGKKLVDSQDSSFSSGSVSLASWVGRAEFRNMEYQVLDKPPASDLDKVATGQWKPLVDSSTVLSDPTKMKFREGVLELEADLRFPELNIRDVIVRADVRKVSGWNMAISVRQTSGNVGTQTYGGVHQYQLWFDGFDSSGGDLFQINKQRGESYGLLAKVHSGDKFSEEQFADVAFSAIGNEISLYVQEKKVHSVRDNDFTNGSIAIGAWKGKSLFRNVRYQTLDSPNSATMVQKADLNADPVPAVAPFSVDQAAKYQEAWASYLKLPVEYTNSIGMKFRLVPPGKFTMGSTPEEIEAAKPKLDTQRDPARPGRIESEGPPQVVTLTRPFYLGTTEVTQLQYSTVVGNNPSWYSKEGKGKDRVGEEDRSNAPVEVVTWLNTGEFCSRLSIHESLDSAYRITPDLIAQTGVGGYRLPTEAEWEFACRAGSNTLFSCGDVLTEIAWFRMTNDKRMPSPVGQLLPNPFGLFDMHGNVWEHVHDAWRPDSYQRLIGAAAVDPRVDVGIDGSRVVRGGSYQLWSSECRSACRDVVADGYHWASTGFRVALSIDAVRQMQTRNRSEKGK